MGNTLFSGSPGDTDGDNSATDICVQTGSSLKRMEDSRGVIRGSCKVCTCTQYCPGSETSWKCAICDHFPTKHQNLGVRKMCRFRGCYQPLDFDPNTGEEKSHCTEHEGCTEENDAETSVENTIQDIECDGTIHPTSTITAVHPPPPDGYLTVDESISSDAVPVVPQQIMTNDQIVSPQMVDFPHPTVHCLVPGMQKCALAECPNPSYIDENGTVHSCCGRAHAKEYDQRQAQQSQLTMIPPGQSSGMDPVAPSSVQKCAIQECPNPCYVDEMGTVHECCGITHAMEHQRRKAIEQQNQVIKGVTHCLLPECNQLVWPFKNYCGRSHADIGAQRGLAPPAPQADPNAPKDSSLCIIPGCTSKKYSDPSGMTHPYCGRTHADLGKKMNIQPTTDKQEDQCELPGCQAPKRIEGTRLHDYCCASHAQQDAPNREARILTDMKAVRKFLDGFSNLKGYTITENQDAKPPGGTLFKRFKQKWDSLPKNQRVTCLAFHGTADKNIKSICQNGYDPKLRRGQAYGAGEYFATTPDIPLGYCKGGKRMLLNELLLGQSGKHHTTHGTIIVMKDPAHDLPRFIVTFP